MAFLLGGGGIVGVAGGLSAVSFLPALRGVTKPSQMLLLPRALLADPTVLVMSERTGKGDTMPPLPAPLQPLLPPTTVVGMGVVPLPK